MALALSDRAGQKAIAIQIVTTMNQPMKVMIWASFCRSASRMSVLMDPASLQFRLDESSKSSESA